jgi:hypothetical protein
MDKSRPFFNARNGERYGTKLILRYPGRSRDMRRVLEREAGVDELPRQITIGYYRYLEDPAGAVAFMPINSRLAIASLSLSAVRDRIAEDLADLAGATDG